MKFMEVIMQLRYLTIYSIRLALCSPEDAIWGTEFDDNEEMIHKVSAFMKRERKGTNWTQCPCFMVVKGY